MKLTTALQFEKQRQDADSTHQVILNKDGKWYHIYDYSAWLLKTVVCTEEMQQARGDAKMLTVTHCQSKTGDYVIAGFPLESTAKYIPNYISCREMEGGDMCIDIQLPDELANLTPDEMMAKYEEWKQSVPVKENRKNMRHPEQAAASIGSILAVLGHYSSYNIRAQLFTTGAMLSAFSFNRQLSIVNPRPYFTRLLDSI